MNPSTILLRFGRPALCGLLGLAFLSSISAASAETLKFFATLAPSSGNAASSGPTGKAELSYDTDTAQLNYLVVFQNLSGPASAGHIHGPASSDSTGVVVQFPVVQSPIAGTATLAAPNANALRNGQLFIDVHTAAHPDGEIRGQIVP